MDHDALNAEIDRLRAVVGRLGYENRQLRADNEGLASALAALDPDHWQLGGSKVLCTQKDSETA